MCTLKNGTDRFIGLTQTAFFFPASLSLGIFIHTVSSCIRKAVSFFRSHTFTHRVWIRAENVWGLLGISEATNSPCCGDTYDNPKISSLRERKNWPTYQGLWKWRDSLALQLVSSNDGKTKNYFQMWTLTFPSSQKDQCLTGAGCFPLTSHFWSMPTRFRCHLEICQNRLFGLELKHGSHNNPVTKFSTT